MKVYIDSNYRCHRTYKDGCTEAEHPYFDTVCPNAIECYKFIPDRDFIQCFDSHAADAYEKQYREDMAELAAVVDDAETMAKDLIGGM